MRRGARALTLTVAIVGYGHFSLGAPSSLEESMIVAARAGLAADVRHYVELGARVDARVFVDDGCVAGTALLAAIESRREEVVLVLLDEGANPEAAASDGQVPLLAAVGWGNESIVRALLESGANPNRSVPLANGTFETPLGVAASLRNDVDVLRALLQAGADPNVVAGSETPLMRAVRSGHEEAVRELVRAKASVDAANELGSTPLLVATAAGDLAMVQDLLQAGADPNAPGAFATPLMLAAAHASLPLVRLLLRSRAAINEKRWMGETALMRVVRTGPRPSSEQRETIRELVKAGAALDLVNDAQLTALDWALACGDEEVAAYLREVGAHSSSEVLASR